MGLGKKKNKAKNQSMLPSNVNNTTPSNVVNNDTSLGVAPVKSKKTKLAEKLDMYDMIIANIYAGTSIVEPDRELDRSHIDIGFSNIASEKFIIKYFLIQGFPDWIRPHMLDIIRRECIYPGVRINFYIYGKPHKINWDSSEMINRMKIWKNYTKNTDTGTAFDYRAKRQDILAKERIVESTSYLNEAELDQKRALVKTSFLIELACKRDDESIASMSDSIKQLKTLCKYDEIKIMELRVNMIDWIQQLGFLSLRQTREVFRRISKKILTDDILSNFNSYKQGRIGTDGVPLGIDISSKVPVLKKFKENPDEAENILISGGTGSGKSMFLKVLLTWLLPQFVITVLDYEGDEYTNIESFVYEGNPADAINISMGKGSTAYFDPMEIGELTGESEIDDELKETAINYILATFRIIVAGLDNDLNKWQESVISTAVRRVYENAGVTNDKNTWHRSKDLRINQVYEEIYDMVVRQEFADENMDNVKHIAAMDILESCKPYFEDGESKSGTFKTPINIENLRNCRFIVFSFGLKGADTTQMDPVILALKQLSVSNISSQISNYCKYVRHCFNVKVWEEYQRWGMAKGSAEIIGNAMTGGRKRGDINIIITNDLGAMLDENNPINNKLAQNLTGYIIGSIPSRPVRMKFCSMYNLMEMEEPLERIYKASTKKTGKRSSLTSRYKHSFCVIMLNTGEKAIVKAMIPNEVLNSKLFRTGIEV